MNDLAIRQDLWRDLRAVGRELMVAKGPAARARCKTRMAEITSAIAAIPAAETPTARAAAPTQETDNMARMARQAADDPEAGEGGGVSGEYKRPDAARALKIFNDEIAPKHAHMATIKGDLSDPYKRIKDECHFPRKVLDFLMQLEDMEEAKRDHWLLAFRLGCTELQMFVPRDLVTMAQGEDGDEVVPVGERQEDDLLVDEEEDEEEEEELPLAAADKTFTEASDEEISRQAGRGRGRTSRPASINSIASPSAVARPH